MVGEQFLPDDGCFRDLADTVEHVDLAKALPAQTPQRPAQLIPLTPDHLGPEGSIGTCGVSLHTDLLRHVEHNRYRQHVMGSGQLEQCAPGAGRCTLVASITVRRPAARRFPVM